MTGLEFCSNVSGEDRSLPETERTIPETSPPGRANEAPKGVTSQIIEVKQFENRIISIFITSFSSTYEL